MQNEIKPFFFKPYLNFYPFELCHRIILNGRIFYFKTPLPLTLAVMLQKVIALQK